MDLKDFKASRKHKGYRTRDLGDNGTGSGEWVELVRDDGHSFGAMLKHLVDDVVEGDKKNPAPPTGHELADLPAFAPTAEELAAAAAESRESGDGSKSKA